MSPWKGVRGALGALLSAGLTISACTSDAPLEPTPVNTAKPRSQAPPVNLPAGVYQLKIESGDFTDPFGGEACVPRGVPAAGKSVRIVVELRPDGQDFVARPVPGGDTLTLRFRDIGPNYIGSRDLRGTVEGVARDDITGVAVGFDGATREIAGHSGSEASPEATDARMTTDGPVLFSDRSSQQASCRSSSVSVVLVSRFREAQ